MHTAHCNGSQVLALSVSVVCHSVTLNWVQIIDHDPFSLLSLLFHAGQAAIKLPSAEASKWAQCTSPGQYTPYIKRIMKTP